MPDMQTQPQAGLGSGVIVSTDGYVVTNNHVIDGADVVTVALTDGREFSAKVVGRDPQTDLAVVKIDAKDLPAVTFADSAKAEVGDRVLAIGNPFGIGETVTSGIVSAKGRNIGILAEVEGYEDFIQTDAAINPGNSGGALVDVERPPPRHQHRHPQPQRRFPRRRPRRPRQSRQPGRRQPREDRQSHPRLPRR
jgi:serine protease Do